MGVHEVVKGVHRVTPVPGVNTYLVEADGLTLIDTALGTSAPAILAAIEKIGKSPKDIRRIVVTHCHPDDYGSLAELKRRTGAPAAMHPVDAVEVRKGTTGRRLSFHGPMRVLNGIFAQPQKVEAAEVEQEIVDGEVLPGGLRVVHAPGHSDGHIAVLWPERGVLFAGDACWNLVRLAYMPFYVDFEESKRSLAKLAALDFDVACFGHGRPIIGGASGRLREKWDASVA
jgi:glyoxylase-like metal-dependent hydrolase (beta-lactamase superfamily II)